MAITFPPTDDTTPDDGSVKYTDPDNGREYYWNGYAWELVCEDGGGVSGDFLLKYGHIVDDCVAPVEYSWNQDVEFKTDLFLRLESGRETYVIGEEVFLYSDAGTLYMRKDVGGMKIGTSFLEIDYNQFRLYASDGDPIHLATAGNIGIGSNNFYGTDPVVLVNGTDNKGYYTGLIEDDESLVNKQYIDSKVVNLQEEIEAIAPTIQAGIWQDGNSATPGSGRFAMRLGNGDITQDYTDTTIVTLIISTTDKKGGAHTFDSEEVGDEIQLFDVEDQNFGLFKIDAIDNSDPNYVQFTVTHLRGYGSTHVDDDVLIRTFKPVTSGDGSAYLLKTGETINAPGPVNYKWDQQLQIESQTFLGLKSGTIQFECDDVNSYCTGSQHYEGTSFRFGNTLNRKYLFLTTNEITTDLEVTDASSDKSLTTKKFVEDKFDFSQYQELN